MELYKETESVYRHKITKDNKIYKRPYSSSEYDSDKDYLECDNDDCQQWFDYELDEKGKIVKELMSERY
ncbi:hypothetical protein ACTWQB_17065 [Piscibacillus sp. B03]|uniref:hypothetical protein n=1 Tax=Piscibacillus sp. B03 TaxID=3457430 RepID=UPI003FCDED85